METRFNYYLESPLTLSKRRQEAGTCVGLQLGTGRHSGPRPAPPKAQRPAVGRTEARGLWDGPREMLSSLDELGLKGILRRAEGKTT